MKKLTIATVGLLLGMAMSAHAQIAAPEPIATPGASTSLNLYQIGKNWGSSGQWAFGVDKSATAGACVQREVHDGQWLAGPCRDIFVLARHGISTAHMGGAIMWNAEHGNATYSLRLGVSVGPAARAFLLKASEALPGLENLAAWSPPRFLGYISDIATVDFAGGYRPTHDASVNGNWTYGPMVKLDIPLDDVYALIKAGL